MFKKSATRKSFATAIVLGLSILLINSCSNHDPKPESTTSSKVIGEKGGKLKGSDNVITLSIPEGSIAVNTSISIQPTNETAPNGIGKVYTLAPEGTQFTKPVTLSFQYTDSDTKGISPARMAIAYKKLDNSWQVMPTLKIDEVTKTITTETTHFSQWTILDALATITSFDPASGIEGLNTTINIVGVNFSTIASENVVTLNGIPLTVISATDTELIVQIPPTAKTGKIIVTVNGQSTTSVDDFILLKPAPTISGFTPTSGIKGLSTTIIITGANFSTIFSENTVTLNGLPLTVTSATATELIVQIPPTATTGKIIVTVNGQSTTSTNDFIVIDTTPTITSFTPTSAPDDLNTTVIIDGTYFSAVISENIVTLNGTPLTVISATSTQLIVQVQPGATTGKIKIVVNGKATLSIDDFTIVSTWPSIASFAPTNCTSGLITDVIIDGTNFSTIVSENIVTLNGMPIIVGSATITQLIVIVPAGATTGKFQITVNGKAILSASNFTVN